jgi:excisionase family DNA binding protein
MHKPTLVPKFLTVDEVADLLRVSKRSVYDWVSQGVIPFHKAGRRTIFLLDEIVEWTNRDSDLSPHSSRPA